HLRPATHISTLSLHDALPILEHGLHRRGPLVDSEQQIHRAAPSAARLHHGFGGAVSWPASSSRSGPSAIPTDPTSEHARSPIPRDRKSTRLNSSHGSISYAVF